MKRLFKRIGAFLKRETVLCISAACACITMLFVPPDNIYAEYIDIRVLCLLLSLMAVVAGFQHIGAFKWISCKLLSRSTSGRVLCFVLVMLPFVTSMFITNDVALITFVPFTIYLLMQIDFNFAIIPVIVLQTIAANLGSMATPIGNPQNLYLFSAYELSPGDFFSVTLLLTAISFIIIFLFSLPVLPKRMPVLNIKAEKIKSSKKLILYFILFLICILTVFDLIHYGITTAVVIVIVFVADKSLLRGLDYSLLATFVCFFIISGNLGRIEEIRICLQSLLEQNVLLTSAAASQIISNVPAAVLLSGFTDQWRPLLEGVNIGELGTPIASLANLITLKQYLKMPEADIKKFMRVFLLANFIILAILLAAAILF